MSMLAKKDWDSDNGAMPVWKLAGVAFGAVSCMQYLLMVVLLGWYFWNVVGGAVAAGICGVVLAVWFVFMAKVSGKIIGRTNGKFGKCRPFLVIGNVLMLLDGALLVNLTHRLPDSAVARSIYFLVFGLVFVCGLALQTVAFHIGRSCLPGEKKSRIIFTVFEVVLVLAFAVLAYVLSGIFAGNGGYAATGFFTASWHYLTWSALAAMVLCVAAIAGRDCYQFYKK